MPDSPPPSGDSSATPCGPRPLPVVKADRPAIRKSRMGWWRAGVLIGVHVLAAVHIAHWLSAGTTLSPLEPSESMEFAVSGIVNAGMVFFGLTLVSTLFLGRFFCGWACHVVALQDAARWLLKKVGVTPRPLRSRAIAAVPLMAAGYMFGVPLVRRWLAEVAPAAQVHLQTAGFWDTFPSWPVSLATFFTCGFACVYLLGAKGFCTYACPYGGLFGLIEPLAPGRIRVTDACSHCGQCTATCSSNVLVHAEVRDYGAVVDSGCMRCMDCVSVCPTDALYFGFGLPAVLTKPRAEPAPRKSLPWREDALLVFVFAATFLAFRGLFDWVPFLFALGLAGCCSALVLKGLHLVTKPSVKVGGWALKRSGSWTWLGRGYPVLLLSLLGATVYGGGIQLLSLRAEALYADTQSISPTWEAQLMAVARGEHLNPLQREQAEAALVANLRLASWSLVETTTSKNRLAWLHLLVGNEAEAETALVAYAADKPNLAGVQFDLGSFYASRNRPAEAEVAYRRALELEPRAGDGRYYALTQLLLSMGKLPEATEVLTQGIEHTDGIRLHHLLGELLAQQGDLEGAVVAFERALAAAKDHAEPVHYRLANALCQLGRTAEGAAHYEAILAVHPENLQVHHAAGLAWADANQPAKARPHLEAVLPKEGFRDPEVLRTLADVLDALGETAEAAKLRAEWEAFRQGR